MNRRTVIAILALCAVLGLVSGCGEKPAEPAAVTEPEAVQPSATTEPAKPVDTPTPAGPVLGADGKPILFPGDVPAPLPEDLSVYNLTYYGYQMAAMQKFVPADVFKDKAKYSDQDRENARMALGYVLDSMKVQEKAQGETVNENVYGWHLLARIYAHKYYDARQDADLEKSLEYYEKCRAKNYAASVADHQELLLAAGRELPEEWK